MLIKNKRNKPSQFGIKMETKINILTYAYDQVLLCESEYEIKMFIMLLFKALQGTGFKINTKRTIILCSLDI